MTPPEIAGELRDRSLERLRHLTAAVAVGATGLAAVFSLIAAWTNPGQTSSGPSQSGVADATQADSAQNQQAQDQQSEDDPGPFAGFVGGGTSAPPVVVTGGSHH